MSQVTKPIALDETLQDVVSAIQGITQGGMIVSTGTVGSATQPVYINGGVPTAIQPEDAAGSFGFLTRGTNAVNIDTTTGNWTMAITPSSAQGTMPWTDYWAQITQFRSGAFCTQIATLIRYSSSDRPDRLAIRHKYAEAGSSYVWSSWKIVYGITTGTPTNIHTALTTQGHTFFHKSGNVVVFRLSVTIGSGFTASRTTKICDLPWAPSEQVLFDRGVSTSGDGPYTHGYSYVNGTTTVLYLGTLPFTDIAQGSTMHISGTYLTKD